ncbi:MAG: hypothetical protein H6606_08285 [Flavobacteriales bacterium]|nr:hypothetical protein [Flavobacteriales bacterium]
MHRLSFLHEPLELLCERLPVFFKQCQIFTGIRIPPSGSAEAIHYNSGKYSRELLSEGSRKLLAPIADSKRKMDWITEEEHPFRHAQSAVVQLDITRELERTFLTINLSLGRSFGKGLLLIQVDPNISQFGITRQNRKLKPEDRTIIGSLILQFCESTIDQQERDRELFFPLTRMKNHLQTEMQVLQKELERKDRNLAKGLVEFADHLLHKLGEEFRVELKLTRRAYDKIGSFDGKFAELERSLAQSVSIAVNSSLSRSNELILDESDLFLLRGEVLEVRESTAEQTPVVGRLSKTHQLLDKYEDAALQVQRNGENIIGRTLGKYCDPPISNAAITDSLNKHAERVLELMKKYPDKWPVIRNNFRSVINLVGRFENNQELADKNSA